MLLKLNNKYRQRGIGLLELMLSLAIISLLLIMATRYYTTTKQSKEVSEAVSLIGAIRSGATHYLGTTMDVMPELIKVGLLPKNITAAATASPWATAVTANTVPAIGLTITMVAPLSACELLAVQLKADATSTACATGTVTVVYKY